MKGEIMKQKRLLYFYFGFLIIFSIACTTVSNNIYTQTNNSNTSSDIFGAIKQAIQTKDYKKLESILASKPNLNIRDEKNDSLLVYALKEDINSSEILLKAGADPNYDSKVIGCEDKESCLKSPLYIGFIDRNIKVLQLLLKYNADPNKDSILARAVSRDDSEIVNLFIEYKADVNLATGIGLPGQSPIFFAETQHLISLLVKNGADLNQIDQRGFTPLMNAIQEDNLGLVKLLIKNNADLNFSNTYNQTSLSLAKSLRNKKIIKLLENAGAK